MINRTALPNRVQYSYVGLKNESQTGLVKRRLDKQLNCKVWKQVHLRSASNQFILPDLQQCHQSETSYPGALVGFAAVRYDVAGRTRETTRNVAMQPNWYLGHLSAFENAALQGKYVTCQSPHWDSCAS